MTTQTKQTKQTSMEGSLWYIGAVSAFGILVGIATESTTWACTATAAIAAIREAVASGLRDRGIDE